MLYSIYVAKKSEENEMTQNYSDRREIAIKMNRSPELQQAMQDLNPHVILATLADFLNNSDYTEMWNWSEAQGMETREAIARLFVKVGKAEGAI